MIVERVAVRAVAGSINRKIVIEKSSTMMSQGRRGTASSILRATFVKADSLL